MKFLIDKIARVGKEWRIVGKDNSPLVEVYENDGSVLEFENELTAYNYVVDNYRRAVDLRQYQPGQQVSLPMADGDTKVYTIVTNNQQAVTMQDEGGQQMTMPHVQSGAQPQQVTQPNQPKTGPPPSALAPNPYATAALTKGDFGKKGLAQLVGVNPRTRGDVVEVLWQDGGVTKESFNLLPQELQTTISSMLANRVPNRWAEIENYRKQNFETEATTPYMTQSDTLKLETQPGSLKLEASGFGRTPYYCKHDQAYLLPKAQSSPEKYCPQCGMVYQASKVLGIGDMGKWIKVAEPPMPGQQAMPSQESVNRGLAPTQSPDDFAQKPKKPQQPSPEGAGGGEGRILTRHEVIEEAETLIRNALWKGIKIGTWDLVEYMRQQYGNDPEELYQGADFAWRKVQFEEQELFQQAQGPGPKQPKPPGLEPEALPSPQGRPQYSPDETEEESLQVKV